MSTLWMDETILTKKYIPNNSRRRVLRSKENISKLKCNKSLKKKLKKYKLRKDGQEDPDIIDVSQTLINSLKIKSPNNQQPNSYKTCEENRPHNYLTKMVRLKKNVTVMDSKPANVQKSNGEIKDESISLTPNGDPDKKQTDAFKLLMDSRNKSIGTNSPGKVKCEEESVGQESVEKKELRAKRILSLNRMAQAKGSLKKLEIEEYREEHIKRKMEDRARKLKHMIVGVEKKCEKKDLANPPIDTTVKISNGANISGVNKNGDTLHVNKPMLTTFDFFKDTQVNINSDVKKISKEDEEFLKKLSPSIRKKENMLCYYQKINKESPMSQDDDDTDSTQNDQPIIKVKLKPRSKVTKKKNKHDRGKKLFKNHENESIVTNQKVQSNISNTGDNVKKRKRYENSYPEGKEIINNDINGIMQSHIDSRPKRNTKKPVKYADDFQLTSSEEELHIFTPKKKRKGKLGSENTSKRMVDNIYDHVNVENCNRTKKVISAGQKECKDIKKKSQKNEDNKNAISKKATKLAPIFVSKPVINSAAIEAKQKFLQSGVPIQLKKSSSYQNNMLASDEFSKVVHIQQIQYVENPKVSKINMINTDDIEDINLIENINSYNKLLEVPILENYSMPKFKKDVNNVLQYIKQIYPKFPVYRTYHLLRGKSKGEFNDCIYPDLDNSKEFLNNIVDVNNVQPDKLNWVDKYKPTTQTQVIGNFDSIRELRRWLVIWTENAAKSKNNKVESELSDFYQSDTDSREAMKNGNNLLIITGQVGTGKTLSVYAVAAELAIKVIEVNASTKRTGKIMLQDLQEATQSHKVDRGKSSTESTQKKDTCLTDNLPVPKKRGRKKKVNVELVTKVVPVNRKDAAEHEIVQENVRTGMSLILIDDADIVFEQDDGFCYAISQLIQSSKRPVILVTSSLSCPHLQKFSSIAKIIKMRPLLPRMLGTWLDIMCLVDNNTCSPGFGAKVLDLFRGDIRKTINYLQFYMASHKHCNNTYNSGVFQNEEALKANADDENSCMSWGDSEGWGDNNVASSNANELCKRFVDKESRLLNFLSPLNNFYFWWNLPNFLYSSKKNSNLKFVNVDKRDKTKELKELNRIAFVLDNMSITDYLGTMNEEPNITSGPWRSYEKDSVVDNENFTSYNRNNDCINEISWELMIRGIANAQKDIVPEDKTEINYPSMSIQRERDRVVSRHKTLTSCLNPCTVLDRRALALDYWSSCRTICRAEKSKTNNSSKRNNRFCHYLKCLNIVCRNEYFDNLGESLCFKK